MKLAVISDVCGYSWSGSEELWLQVALKALADGAEVSACLHQDLHTGKPLAAFRARGGELSSWSRCRIAKLELLRQSIRPNFSRKNLGSPDAILISAGSLPSLTCAPGLIDFLRKCDVPVVVLCQFNTDLLVMSKSGREAIGALLQQAAKVWFVSEQNHQVARRQFAMDLDQAEVVYNPLRTVFDSPLPWPVGSKCPVFACVARMETVWKGQDLLVDILSDDVWASRSWKLRFYGEGPDLERVRKWTTHLGLGNRVEFLGYVRGLVDIWQDASLMVLPSRAEGTPLAVLEAMMCGRPVVTTNVGGNSEVLEDGVTGFLAEAATPSSFGRALERAWQECNRWESMGHAGHLRASRLAKTNPSARIWTSLQDLVKLEN